MSLLLLAPSQAAADVFAGKAQAWLVANVERYAAVKWCDALQHPADGRWAIPYETRLAPAFTAPELTGVIAWTDDWEPDL